MLTKGQNGMALILVVEDEESIAELVAIHARMAGHKAVTMHDGSGVMGFIRDEKPDLVVLDVMLYGEGWLFLDEGDSAVGGASHIPDGERSAG
jgi:CheY-like chemotaxis protein